MQNATCVECGEEYNIRRKHLGYDTCLECGQANAVTVISKRNYESLRSMIPHHFTGSVERMFDKRGGMG